MKPREWTAFVLLGLVWGSSFLWIKVALEEVGPLALVAFRLAFGVLGLVVVLTLKRPRLPGRGRQWLVLGVLGVTNTFLPFTLISWGQQFVDSAVASILNGTVPLFTPIIAHLALHDDRITLGRLAGVACGFLGVVVLVGRDLGASGVEGQMMGQAAVLGAAVSYAASAVFARRNLRDVSPTVQAFLPLVVADGLAWGSAFIVEAPVRLPSLPLTWLALAWLGLLGSCLAYLLYYYLLHNIGPSRTMMVTYIFPLVGVALGVGFLGETADWHLLGGATLVVLGIGVATRVTTRRVVSIGD